MKVLTKIYNSSFSWLSIQEAFTFLVNYGLLVILARLLSPESFGIVALLNLYTGFFGIVSGLGIGKLIIKEQIKNNVKLNALFVGNTLVSLGIFVIGLLLLPIFLWFYFDKDLSYFPLGVLSLLSVFTSSLYTFISSVYIRDRKFTKMAKLMIVSYTISFVLVVVLAYFNRTTLSLLLKQIIVTSVPILILTAFSDFKIKLVFSRTILNYFFTFSKYITLNNLFNYLVRNIDYFILGQFFNKDIIGQYSIAYRVLVTPVKMIVKQIDKVSFPSLARISDKLEEFKRYYLSNIRLIIQTVFPVVIAIILFSDLIVDLFFDSRYDKLATLISILSISALFQSVSSLAGNLFIIGDETKKMFQLTIVKLIILVGFLIVGAYTRDIYYFTFSYIFAYIFTNFPITNYYALRPFKISIFDILKSMLMPVLISGVIMGSIYSISYFYPINVYLKIAFIVVAVLIIYLLINEKIQKILGIRNVWNSRNLL